MYVPFLNENLDLISKPPVIFTEKSSEKGIFVYIFMPNEI